MKISHYKSDFNILMSNLHSGCKTKQIKRYQSPVAMVTKMSVKNRYFSKNVLFSWKLVYLFSFWPWTRICKKFLKNSNNWPVKSVKNRYFSKFVRFCWKLVFLFSFWPWITMCKKFLEIQIFHLWNRLKLVISQKLSYFDEN